MTNTFTTYQEETLLQRNDTFVEIEAILYRPDNLFEPKYGGWYFRFAPLTNTDTRALEDAMKDAVKQLNRAKPRLSRKQPTLKCLDRGLYYCDQLFAPKTNIQFEDKWEARDQHISLKLHFRDDPDGNIFLQCEYCDFMDPFNGIDEGVKEQEYTGPQDWDF